MVYLGLAGTVILVIIDQFIKFWAENTLANAASIPFLKIGGREIINLTYYENTGAAFSILEGKQGFLITLTSLLMIFLLFLLLTKRIQKPFTIISICLILAGGIGNLIDRIFQGYVIDYVEIRLFRFAIFNFADCCVVIGAVLLLIYIIFFDHPVQEVSETISDMEQNLLESEENLTEDNIHE